MKNALLSRSACVLIPVAGVGLVLMSQGACAKSRWDGAYLGGNLAVVLDGEDFSKSIQFGLRREVGKGGLILGGELDLGETNIGIRSGRIDKMGHFKLSLGQSTGKFLNYVTGGAAFASGSFGSDTGAAIGIGTEYSMSQHVSLGAELLHNRFGDFDASGRDFTANTLTARINWTF